MGDIKNFLDAVVINSSIRLQQLLSETNLQKKSLEAERSFVLEGLSNARKQYSIDSFLKDIFPCLLEGMNASRGSIALRSQDPIYKETYFYIVTQKGIKQNGIENELISFLKGNKISQALNNKKPIIINKEGRSSILVPFGWDNYNEGIICVSRQKNKQEEYNTEDEKRLNFYANCLTYLSGLINERRKILEAEVRFIGKKDGYTERHCFRVSKYAKKIANEIGLSIGEQEVIGVGGLLHDVGKVGISNRILKKKGELTEKQYEIIQSHTVQGAELLSSQINHGSSGEDVVDIALLHHERCDGNGYPKRLSKNDIPLNAKIMAMADAFDAMSIKRCYREALSPEKIVKEIRQEIGKQFDPEIATAFLKILPELSWADLKQKSFHTPHCSIIEKIPLEELTLGENSQLINLGYKQCSVCYN